MSQLRKRKIALKNNENIGEFNGKMSQLRKRKIDLKRCEIVRKLSSKLRLHSKKHRDALYQSIMAAETSCSFKHLKLNKCFIHFDNVSQPLIKVTETR